jgi:hypothetical protein
MNRRRFLGAVAAGALGVVGRRAACVEAAESTRRGSRNEQFGIGAIGLRYQGSVITEKALLEDIKLDRSAYALYQHDLHFEPKVDKLESIENHMRNFFECVRSRATPISDVVSQHRTASTCHLANISMRLGRPLRWDPARERFLGDAEADRWLSREQRKGFEIA